MPKHIIVAPNDAQLSLFQSSGSKATTAKATAHPHLDRLNKQERLRRASFTSKEEYYQSPEWQCKRQQKLTQVGNKCELCGKVTRLDIHHLNYDNLYDELMSDLQAVCRGCHETADSYREYDSAYSSYLTTKYGEGEAWKYESEYEEEKFREWRESKQDEW